MKKDEIIENEEMVEETTEEVVEETTTNKKDAKADSKIEELKAKLKAEQEKSEEYFDHLKRNMAEFDNFKKRISKEKELMIDTIKADVIADLLPIIDNFDKALNAETQDESYKSGIEMIYNQMVDALNKMGVEEIEALNTTFDPNFHEAVMHIEDEQYGEKEVVEVFRKGFKVGDKIIRHAMVKVAN